MKVNLENLKKQHSFCPFCAGKLINENTTTLKCSNCKKRLYLDPHPCTGTILFNKNGEILLVKRAVEPKKDFWDLPGGFVSANETAEESATRELQEELGIEVNKLTYITSAYDNYVFQEISYPTLSFIFSSPIENQILVAKDDISAFQFFKTDDIPYDRLAFDCLAEGIRAYLKIKEP